MQALTHGLRPLEFDLCLQRLPLGPGNALLLLLLRGSETVAERAACLNLPDALRQGRAPYSAA